MVADVFVSYYEMFLGKYGITRGFNNTNMFKSPLDNQAVLDMVCVAVLDMVCVVSRQEVKKALFLMGDDKAPGPDGFTVAFFKEAWDIVANDVTDAICEFFMNGKILKELNHTIIALIPKVKSPLRVLDSGSFMYHMYCSRLELINHCFANDLFLFSHGDVQSVCVIKEALDEFKHASGLTPSFPKSTAYFCNVLNHTKISILNVLPFEERRLLVKYLGVPLVSYKLMIHDCKDLAEKVWIRIQDCKNKSLSIANGLQLIQSVTGSMHIYWASVFVLPFCVLLDIEQLMRDFLWSHGSKGKGKAKVGWEAKIGDGSSTSLWFDRWCDIGPLSALITTHDIFRAGLDLSSKVRDVIANRIWNWPIVLLVKYPFLDVIPISYIVKCSLDRFECRTGSVTKPFSVSNVWNSIRPRDDKVNWYALVWYALCIPRHAFNTWLIIKCKLKAHDLVRV
nr:hypothetical protein [Tanacetum cinerariifolium]